jgi:hypothetical protein
MPGHSGLELLVFEESEIRFAPLFYSHHNEYAIQTFKFFSN